MRIGVPCIGGCDHIAVLGNWLSHCVLYCPTSRRSAQYVDDGDDVAFLDLVFSSGSIAWIGILRPNGLLNQWLIWSGLIQTPLEIYRTTTGVYFGMVYTYLPLMILPLLAHLSKMNLSYLDAAYDLGAKPWRAFLDITLPLSKDGIVAEASWYLFQRLVSLWCRSCWVVPIRS